MVWPIHGNICKNRHERWQSVIDFYFDNKNISTRFPNKFWIDSEQKSWTFSNMKIQICFVSIFSSPISNIWYINFTVQISKQALLLDVSHSNKRSHYDRVCFDSDGSGGLMSILNEYVNICSTMYHHSTSVCSAPCLLLRADVLCISLCFGLHLQFVCNHDNTQ